MVKATCEICLAWITSRLTKRLNSAYVVHYIVNTEKQRQHETTSNTNYLVLPCFLLKSLHSCEISIAGMVVPPGQ